MSLRLRDRIEGDLVVEVAFTDYALDVGDRAPAEVRRAALHAVAEEAGALPVIMHQVHGSDVAVVDDVRAGPPTADAMVTSRQHVALLARAADCVPVLLGDAGAGLVGAVHSGRGGLAHGVVPAAVSRLRELGAGQITAWIGPHVCGACYEVPAELRDEVAAQVPSAYSTTSWSLPTRVSGIENVHGRVQTVESSNVTVHSRMSGEVAVKRSVMMVCSLPPWGAVSGRKLCVCTTSVLPSHQPRASPM